MRTKVVKVFFTLILCFTGRLAFAQWADINASAGKDRVEIIWTTSEWPRDLKGFNIKKREIGQITWTKLNSAPICPEISLNKNWSNQGLNAMQEEEMKKKLSNYLKEGKLSESSSENLLLLFRQTGGMKSGDRIRLKKDFDMALMVGFGYIDNNYKSGQNFEYGLFSVQLNGAESAEPIDLYKLSDAEFDVTITFQRPDRGVILMVSAEKEAIGKTGLWGFAVYKQQGREVKLVNTINYASFHEKNGLLEWTFPDTVADNTRNQTYIIAPVNSLQKEMQRITKIYEASLYEPIPAPEIINVSLVNGIDIKVTWTVVLSKKQAERITKVVLERLDPSDKEFESVSTNLTIDSTEYIDKGLKLINRVYTYRLALVDSNGKLWYSQQSSINYQGRALPRKPANLRASIEKEGMANYIVLTWDKIASSDTVTYGYVIYTDEQEKGALSLESMPTIRTNTYRHKVYGAEGRDYSFRVVPVNKELFEGPYAEITVFLGNSRLPDVRNVTLETLPDKSVRITWDYPPLEGLLGFKVLMNGQPIGEGDTLRTDQKSFIVTHPVGEENEIAVFQVLAISKSGVGKSPERSMLISERTTEKSIPAPTGLKVKQVREKGKQYAELTWEKIDQKEFPIKGYVLFADIVKEGDVRRQMDVGLIRENMYRYELTDKKRQKYTFRIGVMGQNGAVASFSEVTLDKSKKQNSEDK